MKRREGEIAPRIRPSQVSGVFVMVAKHLFSRVDWFSYSQYKKEELKRALNKIPETVVRTDGETLAAQIVTSSKARVPNVLWDKADTSSHEADIDLSRIPNTFAFVTHQRVIRKGIEFTVSVPFEGDPSLFEVQPQSYTLNPPFAGVEGDKLVFAFSGMQADVDAWTRSYEESKRKIEGCLTTLRVGADLLNKELESLGQSSVQQRRAQLDKASSDLNAFRSRLGGQER